MHRETTVFLPRYSSMHKSHQPVLPYNTQLAEYASVIGGFTCTRLQQTPLTKVLSENPEDLYKLKTGNDVSLEATLRKNNLYQSIGMIVDQSGEYQGTCVLVSNNCVLLARHILEGMGDVQNFLACFGYFSLEVKKISYNFICIVEDDMELDYAIVQVASSPGKTFGYMKLGYESVNIPLVLLHHPLGKSLMVSVHGVDQTNYSKQFMSPYHDTDFGSSGGAYIAPNGTMVAMHLGCELKENSEGKFNVARYAVEIEKIISKNKSSILSGNTTVSVSNLKRFLPNVARPFFEIEMKDARRIYLARKKLKEQKTKAAQRTEERINKYPVNEYEKMTVRDLAMYFPELGPNILQYQEHTATNKTKFCNINTGWYVCLDQKGLYSTVIDGGCIDNVTGAVIEYHVALHGSKDRAGRDKKFHFENKKSNLASNKKR